MQKTFRKDLSISFSKDEANLVYENYVRYFKASKQIENIRIPEPLGIKDSTIEFEYIPGLDNTLSHMWYRDEFWDSNLMYRIGNALGKLHSSQGDISKDIFLYGDFVPHNVVKGSEKLFFFDTEPAAYRQNFIESFKNSAYVDMVSMLFFIFTCHYFKTPWRFFRNKRSLAQSYLRGYEDESMTKLEKKKLLFYIKKQELKWLFDRGGQHGLIKKYAKYFFVKIVLFVQIYLYKAI